MFDLTQMLDITRNGTVHALRKPADPGVNLKKICRNSADLWALRRRANRPYVAPQRLPAVARVS